MTDATTAMKTRLHGRHVLATTLALFALAVCGGWVGSSSLAAPSSIEAPTQVPTGASAPAEESSDDLADEGLFSFYGRYLDGEYASVVRMKLSLLGMPSDLGVERIKIVEGKHLVEDLMVVDEEIRFTTPADQGKAETIKMVIEGNTTRRPLEIELGSRRFLEIADSTEHADDAPDKESVLLKVHGLGPGNSIGHEGLVFEVNRDVELDALASNALLDADGHGTLSLRKHWQLLPSRRGFSLSHEALKTLIARLPDGDIGAEVVMNGDGKDYEFSRLWRFVMHVPVAGAEGRIIDSNTREVVRELAGRKVAIRGTGPNGTREITVLDAEGRFSVNGLSAGSYIAELLDSRLPGFTQTVFHIKRSDTNVQVTLLYSAQAYRALTSKGIKDAKN